MPMTARPRTELQTFLEGLLESPNVYYQPPSNMHMSYPCIEYERNTFADRGANNDTYLRRIRYTLKLIDKNPDSQFVEKLKNVRYCSHTRHYVADNLNHDVFEIYW